MRLVPAGGWRTACAGARNRRAAPFAPPHGDLSEVTDECVKLVEPGLLLWRSFFASLMARPLRPALDTAPSGAVRIKSVLVGPGSDAGPGPGMTKARFRGLFELERVMGIEPTLAAWEAAVLPLNYTRRPPWLTPAETGMVRVQPPFVDPVS